MRRFPSWPAGDGAGSSGTARPRWTARPGGTDARRLTEGVLDVDTQATGPTLRPGGSASPRPGGRVLADALVTQGIDHVIKQPVRGHDAAAEVLDAAEEHNAELIVIGLRRRTPVGKLIMGSVSQRILLEADCPVLAVKAG